MPSNNGSQQKIPGRSARRNEESEDGSGNVQLPQVPQVLASPPTFETAEAPAGYSNYPHGPLRPYELTRLINNPQFGLCGPDVSGIPQSDYHVPGSLQGIEYDFHESINNRHDNFSQQPAGTHYFPADFDLSYDWQHIGNGQPLPSMQEQDEYADPSFSGDPGNLCSTGTHTSQPSPSQAVQNVDQSHVVPRVQRSEDSSHALNALLANPENCDICPSSFERLRDLLRHLATHGATGRDPKAKHGQLVLLADAIIHVPCLIEKCKFRGREDSLLRHLIGSAGITTAARGLHSPQDLAVFHQRHAPLPEGSVEDLARSVKAIMTRFQAPKKDQAMCELAHYWAKQNYDVARADYGLGKAAAMEGIMRFEQASNALGETDDTDADWMRFSSTSAWGTGLTSLVSRAL